MVMLCGVLIHRIAVVVEPTRSSETSRGARLLYVAMTRAVQELAFVTTASTPTPASPEP